MTTMKMRARHEVTGEEGREGGEEAKTDDAGN